MMQRLLMGFLGSLVALAHAVPVEDLTHGNEDVLPESMDATRPVGEQVARLRSQVAALMDIPDQLAAMQEALSKLQGQMEQQAHELAHLQQKPAMPEPKKVEDASALYLKGLRAMKQEHYAKAGEAFQALIDAYPKDPLVPESYYWLAMAYVSDQKTDQAQKAMETFMKLPNHPADKEPSACMSLAAIASAKGQAADSKRWLERVLKDHPGSPEAAEAKKQLNALS